MRRHEKASTAGSTQRQAAGLGRFFRGVGGIGILLALALALIPASASATTTRLPQGFSPITGSGTGVSFPAPSGVAVDETSGNIFVNDGNNAVDVLGAEGGVPTGVASPFRMTGFFFGFEPSGAAVDNVALSPSKGTLYVTDVAHSQVKKFVLNSSSHLYEAAGELSPTSGPEFEEPLGVAVDTHGNVFVADYGSRSVVKFSPTGAQLARISTLAAGLIPGTVAVDAAGDLFLQSYGEAAIKYTANGSGEIEPGVFTHIVPSGATGVAVDQASNRLFVGLGSRVAEYDATTLALKGEFGAGAINAIGSGAIGASTRIAVNSTTDRVYVSDNGASKQVVVFGPAVDLPTVKAEAASGLTPNTATLNGTINPEGLAVSGCVFKWGTTTAYGNTTPCEGAIPPDSADHAITASLTGLTPGATYHFQIVGTNANGSAKSEDETFKAPNPVTTEPASEVKGTKATLNGVVRPEGQPVSECKFEWGTTTAYGNTTPCVGSIPTDNGEHAVTAALSGLQPTTAYHFRIVASGGSGTATGTDQSFTTATTVKTEPANPVTGVRATLNASVNPEGAPVTECRFEWGTNTAYGKTAPCEGALPADESAHIVSAALDNLQPDGTIYHFRIVVNGGSGVLKGEDRSFKAPDTVITSPATAVTTTTATLNGSANPDGHAFSQCLFEYGTTAKYGQTAPCVPGAASIGNGTSAVPVSAALAGLVPGTTYHFRLEATNANGPIYGADRTLLTVGPEISAAWAEGVTRTEANLDALINPHGAETTYHVEWGTTTAYGSSTPELLVGPDSSVHKVTRVLTGLQEDTTYHYRFVATSSVATDTGEDHTFHTYSAFASDTECSNQAFRTGPSAQLPDCRAYEMVSPVDKAGSSIKPNIDFTFSLDFGSEQAALDGDKIAYASESPFGDARGNFFAGIQYIAGRTAAGWSSHAITPLHEHNVLPFPDPFTGPGRYAAFSEDLSTGFLYDDAEPPLTADALIGSDNYYLRDNVHGTYTALTTQLLSGGVGEMGFMGFSKDGSHTIFATRAQLTPDARPDDSDQLYDYHDGELELASVLPDGQPAHNGVAGNAEPGLFGREMGETRNAISADGSRIFWMDYLSTGNAHSGRLYVRVDGETTIPVSESVSSAEDATYWMAAANGSQVVFSAGENLYRFDVDTETPTLIAGGVDPHTGVLGTGEDASSVYFLSTEALAPGASVGRPNLYLDREGTKTFIATLVPGDLTASNGDDGAGITQDFSQVTPDGSHVVFDSRARLTGYDNTSADTSEAAQEVYAYDAPAQRLLCISCNPSGGRPQTRKPPVPHSYEGEENVLNVQTAAWLPTPRRGTYTPRMVQDDGRRVFFNSLDALVPQDTNGAQDVYEWEAPGTDSCTEGDSAYSALNGGCIGLISTGESPKPSAFVDANEGSRDVFFTTDSSIDPEDPGLRDIYDARVDGGFPPRSEPPPCLGDACQSPPAAPLQPSPASAGFKGEGNPKPTGPRKSCRARRRKAGKGGGTARGKKANRRCKRHNRRAGR